jgi:hypothetical protein
MLGDTIKSTKNYCLIKKWYGGYNSDYIAKNYEYDKKSSKRRGENLIQKI